MKPVVLFVDDEPHNLTVFEAAFPDDWEIITHDQPMKALDLLDKKRPWVIVSDQRMPGTTGVEFLEIAKRILPKAVRIIVTGYSDEDLIIESVRKAQVFDYIRKPWDPDELVASIQRAVDHYKITEENAKLIETIRAHEKELQEKSDRLEQANTKLELAMRKESDMREELECWVPQPVLWAVKNNDVKFPMKKDLVGITFDIIKSREIHNTFVDGRPLRSLIIQAFSESIIRNGGWRESHSGDSAYGHFGLWEDHLNPFEAALAVAREFRVSLRSICGVNNHQVECGIALHLCQQSIIDVHTVQINTSKGSVIQKSFDTTSNDIDLLHKMEKLVHELPGSNIILTEDFVEKLSSRPKELVELGPWKSPHHRSKAPKTLHLIPSDLLSSDDLKAFQQRLFELAKKKHDQKDDQDEGKRAA